jgi:hypothetical protein
MLGTEICHRKVRPRIKKWNLSTLDSRARRLSNTPMMWMPPFLPSINRLAPAAVFVDLHHFEHCVIYHMRICPFCKDSLMPVHTTKSLEALTELSQNPHSLRTSLESSDQTMQFSPYQDLNQEHFNKYTPKPKLKLPKSNNTQQWLTINKELEAVLQMRLPLGELHYRGITVAVNSFLSIIHWFLTIKCGTVDEGTTKEERKQKDKKNHND